LINAKAALDAIATELCQILEIELLTDEYPNEISWDVKDLYGNIVAGEEYFLGLGSTQYSYNYCLVPTCDYIFTIYDSIGDGICCNYGSGSYSVTYNEVQITNGGSYGSEESVNFGCSRIERAPAMVKVMSAGKFVGNYARIEIDGNEIIFSGDRGLNVVVMNEYGSIISTQSFDTHISSNNAEGFVSFISGLEDGSWVLISVRDEASNNLTPDAKNAIKSLGSNKIDSLGYRHSWCIIGMKSAAADTVIEDYNPNGVASCTFLTSAPTSTPTSMPISTPTSTPTPMLTSMPTSRPTPTPTTTPTSAPTSAPIPVSLTPSNIQSNKPSIIPSNIPSFPLSETPSSIPSSIPSDIPSSSSCEDALIPIAFNGNELTCTQIVDFNLCDNELVASHCPKTCQMCSEYKCEDSQAPFSANGQNLFCVDLHSFLTDEEIENKCEDLVALATTCRGTCKICD